MSRIDVLMLENMNDKQIFKKRAEKAEWIELNTKRAKGKKEYLRMLRGDYVNKTELIKAMCYHCTNYAQDGKFDCGCILCPIYMSMNYRKISQEDGEIKVEE